MKVSTINYVEAVIQSVDTIRYALNLLHGWECSKKIPESKSGYARDYTKTTISSGINDSLLSSRSIFYFYAYRAVVRSRVKHEKYYQQVFAYLRIEAMR